MSSQGSWVSDIVMLGLCLLAVIAIAWWVMPESLERDIARAMQAALPLGDATVVEYDHALNHPEAVAVRECLKKDGPFAVWQKPDGRFVRLCQLPDGKFGTQICAADYNGKECFHEITAYVKNKFRTLEQLIKYLENMGANQVWP